MGVLGTAAIVGAAAAGCGQVTATPLVVTAQSFRFAPAAIEVAQGHPVRLSLQNADTTEHDFQVDGLPVRAAPAAAHQHGGSDSRGSEDGVPPGLHLHAEAGTRTTVTFTPAEHGTFTVYCTVPGHREAGMVAVLVVR